jgi:hypothetical protein
MMDTRDGIDHEGIKQYLSIVQDLVDELAKNPQYAQYIERGQLALLDSRFEPVDLLLRAGHISGRR